MGNLQVDARMHQLETRVEILEKKDIKVNNGESSEIAKGKCNEQSSVIVYKNCECEDRHNWIVDLVLYGSLGAAVIVCCLKRK